MDNIETQKEEVLVLQSIYDEKYFFVECMHPPSGRFSADVLLSDPFHIKLRNHETSHNTGIYSALNTSKYEEFEVQYLPTINLYFEFPENYPTDSPPAFLLACSWLSYEQLSKLCKHLEILWKDGNGEVILFQWIQFLKEETLNFLGIEKCIDITELSKYKVREDIMNSMPSNTFHSKSIISHSSQNSKDLKWVPKKKISKVCSMPSVKPSVSGGNGSADCRAFLEIADGKVLKFLLNEYNEVRKAEHFSLSWHLCNICFLDKQGSEFVIFESCHHFFCKDCIKSYFELMIAEGNVCSLNCPYDKCSTQADGTFVKQIIHKDVFERYDSLLLARTLETMSDVAYCPRKACQCPLIIDVSGRMGTCPACNFVFCSFCKAVYHGIEACQFKSELKQEFKQQVYNDYLEGDEKMKAEIEKRYGKRTIQCLVDEVLSDGWLESNTKICPRCNASIEKMEGCNKITCFKCGVYFCWLCQRPLKTADPYEHFSDRSSKCYNKLFLEHLLVDENVNEPE